MKPRDGWVLTHQPHPPGNTREDTIGVVIPSKKMTNRAVDDLVREYHLRKYGRLWPNKVTWVAGDDPLLLTLRTPVATYRLHRTFVYG